MDEGTPANRANRGQWKPGQSGNPNGRSRVAAEVRALAQQHCPEAVRTLHELMTTSADERVRLSAAEAILDRGIGKATSHVDVTVTDDRTSERLEEMRKSDRGAHLLALAEAIAQTQGDA